MNTCFRLKKYLIMKVDNRKKTPICTTIKRADNGNYSDQETNANSQCFNVIVKKIKNKTQ